MWFSHARQRPQAHIIVGECPSCLLGILTYDGSVGVEEGSKLPTLRFVPNLVDLVAGLRVSTPTSRRGPQHGTGRGTCGRRGTGCGGTGWLHIRGTEPWKLELGAVEASKEAVGIRFLGVSGFRQ